MRNFANMLAPKVLQGWRVGQGEEVTGENNDHTFGVRFTRQFQDGSSFTLSVNLAAEVLV